MIESTTIYDLTHLKDETRHRTALLVMLSVASDTAGVITALLQAAMNDQDQQPARLIQAAGRALTNMGAIAGGMDEEERRIARIKADNREG
jgi:hypothetical protein